MSEKLTQLVQRLKQDAAAQKKKTAALGLLLLVLLIAVGNMLIGGESPQTTSAAPVVVAPSGPQPIVVPTAPKTPTPGTNNTGRSVTRAVPENEPRNVNMSALPRTLSRDPFRSPSWFSRSRSDNEDGSKGQVTWLDRFSQHLSELQGRVDATEQLVDQKLSELELQSTMIGSINSAYISGRLVHQGDEIEGFSVAKIETRQVTLTFSGVTRILKVR